MSGNRDRVSRYHKPCDGLMLHSIRVLNNNGYSIEAITNRINYQFNTHLSVAAFQIEVEHLRTPFLKDGYWTTAMEELVVLEWNAGHVVGDITAELKFVFGKQDLVSGEVYRKIQRLLAQRRIA